jgi:hypothetical protein
VSNLKVTFYRYDAEALMQRAIARMTNDQCIAAYTVTEVSLSIFLKEIL